jgi:hypothetical protein
MTRNQITAAVLFALALPLSSAAFLVHSERIEAQRASHATKSSGGMLTVVSGTDKGLVRIRSTRFF